MKTITYKKSIKLILLMTILFLNSSYLRASEGDTHFIEKLTSSNTIELNFIWDEKSPLLSINPPYSMALRETHKDTNGMMTPDVSHAADIMYFSGQHGAPTIDAIGHIGVNGMLYGGLNVGESETSKGLKALGIESYPTNKMVNRAVLLDVARFKGVASLPAGYKITAEDLLATEKKQGVKIKVGDSVLIRTGYGQYFENDKARYMGYRPGPDASAARWLAKKGIFLTGADQLTYEVYPKEGTNFPAHRILLAENGIYIVENLNLEKLGETLAQRNTYEFVLILNPPRIRGATGMIINAFAIIPSNI